jgi:hypothetical protein
LKVEDGKKARDLHRIAYFAYSAVMEATNFIASITTTHCGVGSADRAARVIFQSGAIDTPLTSQLRCIRRDFARLKKLARNEKWTDDTPVPPEVFGPMWPEGVEPYWAVELPQSPV